MVGSEASLGSVSRGRDRASENATEDAGEGVERLDLRGLKCPLPVLKSAKRLSALAPGARLLVLSDDPLAGIDLPLFCTQEGQRLVEQRRHGEDATSFLIERGPSPPGLGQR